MTLEDQLVVAISSRALFNFEEENRVFEKDIEPLALQVHVGAVVVLFEDTALLLKI